MTIPRHEVVINGIAKDVCYVEDVEKLEEYIMYLSTFIEKTDERLNEVIK